MSNRLSIGDVVLLYTSAYGGKQGIGLIKYIGSIRSSSCDITKQYVGVELIEPVENGHDGYIEGYQYFQCKKSYGIHTSITNVIKILESSQVMLKLQDVISIFKTKLSQYIIALNERDSYINDLCINQKKYQTLISTLTANTNNTNQLGVLQQQTVPLTPIQDSNNIREMQRRQKMENHQSLTQMMDKVDSVITSQSLAIKLNAHQVGFDKYQNTPLTQFSPNTYASSTPSSYTPAPNPMGVKHPMAAGVTPSASNNTMIVDGSKTDTTGDDDIEPDPLIALRMDPIAETHSSRNPNRNTELPNFDGDLRQNMSHNTLDTRSPSQPHLLNTDTNLSTLSTHSPFIGPEYDEDIHSTSSYLSAGSSAYNTPKSLTANAHGLLSTYNYNRKLSKQSISINSRPRNSSKSHQSHQELHRDKRKSGSKSKKRKSSPSHSHSKNKYVPHITTTATNTPTFTASNDAIFFEENKKENKKKSKAKRKKSKPNELKVSSDDRNRTLRSASAQFTPRTFQAIQEEEAHHQQQMKQDQLPASSPLFIGHHSTPIFNTNNMYYDDADDDEVAMTPELPPNSNYNKLEHLDIDPHRQYHPQQRSSLPPNQIIINDQQRSSLPPVQLGGVRHMTMSSQNTIPVPNFMYNQMQQQQQQQHYTGSLRNIHEDYHPQRMPQHYGTPGTGPQNPPQLDQWVELELNHSHSPLAPPTNNGGFEHDMEEIVDAPRFNKKAKSMPAKHMDPNQGRYPSRQSIDMNPYIDQQFIFQPQHNNQYNNNQYLQYNTTSSSGTSPMNNSPQLIAQQQQHQRLSNSPVILSQQLRPPAILTNINNNNMKKQHIVSNKIGTVKFAPRKSVSKALRRMSKNDQRRKSYHRQQRQCVQTQQKQIHVSHNTFNHNISNAMHQDEYTDAMDGFTMTDAMYD